MLSFLANEDFHEREGDETTPPPSEQPRKEVDTKDDTNKAVMDRHIDNTQNEINESLVHDRDIRTSSSTTEDALTDTVQHRHEQFEHGSVEKVVGRWQCEDNEDDGRDHEGEPRPKRSAMKTHWTEGKRKSVSFVEENGELENDEETFETDEKNRER